MWWIDLVDGVVDRTLIVATIVLYCFDRQKQSLY